MNSKFILREGGLLNVYVVFRGGLPNVYAYLQGGRGGQKWPKSCLRSKSMPPIPKLALFTCGYVSYWHL